MQTKIFAHRGASADRAENTMEAFKLSMKHGADGVELNVHSTKDGHIVIIHDLTVDRVSTGRGIVSDFTLDELKRHSFSKLCPSQDLCPILTLEELYSILAENTAFMVNVELKTMERQYPFMPEKLIQMESRHDMSGRVIYSSFNHHTLKTIKELSPESEIGLLYDNNMVEPWEYAKRMNAMAIHPNINAIKANPEIVEKCHENGIKVNVWTVDEPTDIEAMMKLGVDGIMTRKPNIAYFLRDD